MRGIQCASAFCSLWCCKEWFALDRRQISCLLMRIATCLNKFISAPLVVESHSQHLISRYHWDQDLCPTGGPQQRDPCFKVRVHGRTKYTYMNRLYDNNFWATTWNLRSESPKWIFHENKTRLAITSPNFLYIKSFQIIFVWLHTGQKLLDWSNPVAMGEK